MSPYFDPNEYWVFSMFGLFYPIFLFANLGMILLWMLIDFKYLFASLITILIGWSHLQGFVNFSMLSDEPGDLTVMSYNANFLYTVRNGSKTEKKGNLRSIQNFLDQHDDVDIFCLQETSRFTRNLVSEKFPDYHTHKITNRGTYILSRYPIIDAGEINFGTITNSCVWADVRHPSGKVRVYCTHLQSNKVSTDAVKVMDNANLKEEKTWTGIQAILEKYRIASRKRVSQAKLIADHSAKVSHPTLIVGDVNDPPTSYTYSRLCGSFQDSFVAAGSGIGTTYAGKIPMLRIDYIFADDNFKVESFEVLKEPYSDHFPVKGVYSLID